MQRRPKVEKRTTKGKRETEFLVKADFKGLEESEERPLAKAYLFSSSGDLLDSKPLDAEGRATLKTEHGFGERGRFHITVGPETEQIRRLRKLKGRSRVVQAELGKAVDVAVEVFRPEWACWFGLLYEIAGNVKKRIIVDSDTTIYAPVCTSVVEIYEVDYVGFVFQQPLPILERFRDNLLRLREPIPELPEVLAPPPPPPPPPPVGPFAGRRAAAFQRAQASRPAGSPPLPMAGGAAGATPQTAGGEFAPGINYAMLEHLPIERLRDLIIANIAVFRPYLCLFLAGWYPMTLLGTACTDVNGRFNETVILLCGTEQPDLYFKVKQCISGCLRYVYEPKPVPCYTYWDHPSGEEVNLLVTDPQARCHFENPPADRPGVYVMPIGIGNDGWWQIHQGADDNRGLYQHPTLTYDPYGRTLDIQMQFHDGLRDPAGPNVMYYRWSYQKVSTSGWTHIDTPIVHRHLDQTDPAHPKIKTYKLGPNPNPDPASDEDNLFEVPPDLDWYIENDRVDRPFAKWDTTTLAGGDLATAAGVYKLKLEMFDASGNKVSPAAGGFKYFVPTGSLVDDEWPVNDSPAVEPDGSIVFYVHIDNNDTVANIGSVGFVAVPPQECQFLEYTSLSNAIEVKYEAYHPNGFLAEYDLSIRRGQSGTRVSPDDWLKVTDPAGPPLTTPVAKGLPGVTAGSLLGTYPRCAFAAHLHTFPRTRDGYYRIRVYEAHDVGAFALVQAQTPVKT
jgi:hypothetical protein